MLLQEKLKSWKLVLASKSPRRQQLLKGLDVDFEIRTKEIEEVYPAELKGPEVAEYLSRLKAAAFSPAPNEIIITSDTIVVQGDTILEKAADRNEAVQMLQQLSGRQHTVYTAVCLRSAEKTISFVDATIVHFRTLEKEEIDYYIDTYQPYDKAGAYGAQEWIGYIAVEKLEGSYFSVMGLPLHRLHKELLLF